MLDFAMISLHVKAAIVNVLKQTLGLKKFYSIIVNMEFSLKGNTERHFQTDSLAGVAAQKLSPRQQK